MNENLSHQNCCPAEVLNHLHDFTKKSYQTSKNLSIVPKLENEPGILNHPTKTRQFVHGFDLESWTTQFDLAYNTRFRVCCETISLRSETGLSWNVHVAAQLTFAKPFSKTRSKVDVLRFFTKFWGPSDPEWKPRVQHPRHEKLGWHKTLARQRTRNRRKEALTHCIDCAVEFQTVGKILI